MHPMSFLRMVLIVLIGVLLYFILMRVVGWNKYARLKKRGRTTNKDGDDVKKRIIYIYIITLMCLVAIGFILIKYWFVIGG